MTLQQGSCPEASSLRAPALTPKTKEKAVYTAILSSLGITLQNAQADITLQAIELQNMKQKVSHKEGIIGVLEVQVKWKDQHVAQLQD